VFLQVFPPFSLFSIFFWARPGVAVRAPTPGRAQQKRGKIEKGKNL